MGEVVFHSTGTNPTPYDQIHHFNNVSFDDALVSARAEAEKLFQIMAAPISITTSNTFNEEDWNSVIDCFYIPQGDRQPIKIEISEPYYEDDEDCGDCAELNEFLDSLQKKCDEAV